RAASEHAPRSAAVSARALVATRGRIGKTNESAGSHLTAVNQARSSAVSPCALVAAGWCGASESPRAAGGCGASESPRVTRGCDADGWGDASGSVAAEARGGGDGAAAIGEPAVGAGDAA